MIKIPLIPSLIHYYNVFYGYAGKKIYILILLFLFGGLSECIGISMLLPVLNVDKAVSDQDQYTKTIHNFLESIGVNLSLPSLIILLLTAFLFKGAFVFSQKTFSAYIKLRLIRDI